MTDQSSRGNGNGVWVAIVLLSMLLLSIPGCGPKAGGSMDAAMSNYQSQRYDHAHDEASALMAKSTGAQRERAAYISGLAAYQSGKIESAERDLGIASVSSDPQIAGNAKAMLGQLRLDQSRPREAAGYFSDASRLLAGDDARQAAWHAGLAYRQAGDEASAKRWLNTASSSQFDSSQPQRVSFNVSTESASTASTLSPTYSKSTSTPVSAAQQSSSPSNVQSKSVAATHANAPMTVGFTLQIGAFSDKKRAQTAAEEAESLSKKEGLGRVRIFPRRDARGQPLYLVQLGWWVTRNEAVAARERVGRLEYIVAPAPVE